ncbi:Hypothetical protein (Fragment) [Durusdinium trenchii]|uniref:Uncharacterized protein n=1 Tax=Durusdinium trenchii TaxID=1381693 RepID=A0ABP0PW58_9DINO
MGCATSTSSSIQFQAGNRQMAELRAPFSRVAIQQRSTVHTSVGTHAASAPPTGGSLPPVTAPVPMGSMVVKVPNGARVGQLLQMTTPHGTKVQCQVPAGLPPDGTFQVQYPLPTKATLTVHDESARFTSKTVAAHMLPSYWTNVKIPDNDAFDQMIYVDRSLHDTFNELLELTYREKATQDRKCPKRLERERCKKTPGGCPCVQPGGSPGLPTAFKVRRVVRVEDSDMWARYVEKREEISSRRQAPWGPRHSQRCALRMARANMETPKITCVC